MTNVSLLMETRDYLRSELRAWRESGSKEVPSIIESLINDIDIELALGHCELCNGPMVLDDNMDGPFCGSWLYMEGGCAPAPRSKK